jgi:hypothetical protein
LTILLCGVTACDFLLGSGEAEGTGVLNIGFGASGANASSTSLVGRSAIPTPEKQALFRYEMALAGPGGQMLSASLAPGQSFNGQVALGQWLIYVEAYDPAGVLAGTGSASVTVRAGQNQALVKMKAVGTAGPAAGNDPVPLAVALELSAANWAALLDDINAMGTYVELDLSDCTASTHSSGGGLYGTNTFDPDYTNTNAGKGKIVSLVLPGAATGIAAASGSSDNSAFKNFTALESVSGAGIQTVGDFAFWRRTALTVVNLPAATTIAMRAFYGCTALTTVSLPASLTTIGDMAFSGCTSLVNITVDPGNLNFSASGGMLLNKAGNTLIAFPSAAGSVTLPGTITAINQYAFASCRALTVVNLPAATSIGYYAFVDCYALTTVSLPAVTSINYAVFSSCYALTTVNLPAAVPPVLPSDRRLFEFTNNGAGAGTTLTIKVPSGTVAAYVSAWGVAAADTTANTETSVYGSNHKRVIITDTP